MKTMATEAPTSHTSARCSATTPGAAVVEGTRPPAVAAYAITHSQRYATNYYKTPDGRRSIGVFVPGHQCQGCLEKNVKVEQHRPVLDVIEVELDALLDFLFAVDFAAPAVDLRPAGNSRLDAMAREISVDRLVEQPALQLALHGVRTGADQ